MADEDAGASAAAPRPSGPQRRAHSEADARLPPSVQPPGQFDFSKPQQWGTWIRRFEGFRLASSLHLSSDANQVNTLIRCMGDEADDVLRLQALSDVRRQQYQAVKDTLDAYFVPRINVVYKRARFNQRTQQADETVDSFVAALVALGEKCSYGALHDELLRDRLVVGLRDTGLAERLQMDKDLTLEKAIDQARRSEGIKTRGTDVKGEVKMEADAVTVKYKKQKGPSQPKHTAKDKPASCCRCGETPAHGEGRCSARCGERGHCSQHITVKRKGDAIPRPVPSHENHFKCPFCSPELYKPAGYPKMAAHLASHKLKAISHRDYIIYGCGLGCDGKAKHFHCCYCSKSYRNKKEILKHLDLHCPDGPCQSSAVTPGPSTQGPPAVSTPGPSTPAPSSVPTPGPSTAVPTPDPSTPGPPTPDPSTPGPPTPGPSTPGPPAVPTPGPSTPGPPAVPTLGSSTPGPPTHGSSTPAHPAVPTPGPSTPVPSSVPTLGSSTPGPPTHGSSTPAHPAVPTPGSSTPGPPAAPCRSPAACRRPQRQYSEQNFKKDSTKGVVSRQQVSVQCPHCSLTVNKRNLKKHIERKHKLSHAGDTTAARVGHRLNLNDSDSSFQLRFLSIPKCDSFLEAGFKPPRLQKVVL